MDLFAKSKQNHISVLKTEARNLETLLHFTYFFSSGCSNKNGEHEVVKFSRKVTAGLFQRE
jgi:hypothetical protein